VNSEYKSGSFWLLISLVVLLVVPQLPQSQLAVGGNHTDALIVVLIMVLACVAVVLLRNRRPPPPPPGT
jgi:type VI protein secretion system component VasK